MNRKYPWLPIDERLIPDIFSFSYPKSPWVRVALAVEMLCAVLALIGTLVLVMLPKGYTTTPVTSNANETTTTAP